MEKKGMEEMLVVMKRFGDEQSTLLDRFERLSFEVHLNQAILGRSLSEPCAPRYQLPPPPQHIQLESKVIPQEPRHRGLRFKKMLKKFFKPIFGSRKEERKDSIPVPPYQKDFKFMKALSRSVRV